MLTPGRKAVNSPVRIAANFQDDTRTDIDPDTVKVRFKSPCRVEYSYTYAAGQIIRADTGDYYIDFTPNESGRWYYRWETTGDNKTIGDEREFVVQSSPFYDGIRDAYR